MFKFNNNHIFTGYLKQLLASFNLPKFKIYTKELEQQQLEYLNNKETIEAKLKSLQTTLVSIEEDLQESAAAIAAAEKENDVDYVAALVANKLEYSKAYRELETEIRSLQNKIPQIIPTTYHSNLSSYIYPNTLPDEDEKMTLPADQSYPSKMRYMPYLKDGYLQVYSAGSWHSCHDSFKDGGSHYTLHKKTQIPYKRISYAYGQKILNYTKNLQIQNTIYDSYTHEYLGNYLRFQRDYANLDLMPLYNCFSNRACPHLDLKFVVGTPGSTYEVKFKTDQSFESALYKYYMVPVKFFKDYTIAIDSEASIELCCCVYNEYLNADEDFSLVPKLTYQCFGNLQFKTPVLYNKIQNLNKLLLDPQNVENDLCQQEDNLKLILKIPANNKSSIVILEGDYTKYNDMAFTSNSTNNITDYERQLLLKNISVPDIDTSIQNILGRLKNQKNQGSPKSKQTNKTVINYATLDACKELANKLITPLQLLRTNTGESYPFADRLVEYLTGNVITVNETIKDNVVRAKTVIAENCPAKIYAMDPTDGIWEPILQCLVYDYINKNQNTHDINHDILGFIDKDVEKWYAATKETKLETIANINIYNN